MPGLELINVRVRSIGRTPRPTAPRLKKGGPDPAAARKGQRRIFVPERESFTDVDIYDGQRLLHGNAISGPALIERTDTTIFVSDNHAATVDEDLAPLREDERWAPLMKKYHPDAEVVELEPKKDADEKPPEKKDG